jgi:hypothetical protein
MMRGYRSDQFARPVHRVEPGAAIADVNLQPIAIVL